MTFYNRFVEFALLYILQCIRAPVVGAPGKWGRNDIQRKNIKLYPHYSNYYIFNFLVFLEPWEGAGTKFFGIFAIITICYTYKKINYLNMKNWISPLIASFQFLLCKPCTSILYKIYLLCLFTLNTHWKHIENTSNSKVEWQPGMRIRHFFPRIRIWLSWKNIPDPTWNRSEEKIYLYFR